MFKRNQTRRLFLQSHTDWQQSDNVRSVGERWRKWLNLNSQEWFVCNHRNIEGKVRERTVKGRQVTGMLAGYESKKCEHRVKKKGIRNRSIIPLIICIWYMDMECNTTQHNTAVANSHGWKWMKFVKQVHVVCVSEWNGKSNEDVWDTSLHTNIHIHPHPHPHMHAHPPTCIYMHTPFLHRLTLGVLFAGEWG